VVAWCQEHNKGTEGCRGAKIQEENNAHGPGGIEIREVRRHDARNSEAMKYAQEEEKTVS
jgi:hypothetical protein